MQRNTGYFPTESLEPCGNRLFSRSALNEGYLFRGSLMPEGILMDQVKIGKFIAELRRWAGLTQEALGEKIGVTNKTISRWENGDYMPNIEMLQLLAEEFSISISEILAGEKFSDEESRHKADENAIATTSTSTFSLKERKSFFKKKWRREHFSLFAVLALILIAAVVFPLVFHKPWLLGIAPLVALVEYGFQNNRMMVYVEKCLYK